MQDHKSNLKICVMLVLAIISLLGLVIPASADKTLAATGECTNYENEGIIYHLATYMAPSDVDQWRYPLTVSGGKGGEVVAIEVSVSSDSNRYQCTEPTKPTDPYDFTCNSIPQGAVITDIYFWIIPDSSITHPGTEFVLTVENDIAETQPILKAKGEVVYPPYPCAVNEIPASWTSYDGKSLVVNTDTSCTAENDGAGKSEDNTRFISGSLIHFKEKPGSEFAVVNQVPNDIVDLDRFVFTASPAKVNYDYKVDLYFSAEVDGYECETMDASHCYYMVYEYKAGNSELTLINKNVNSFTGDQLPLRLKFGSIYGFTTYSKNLYGEWVFPQSTDFDFKLYYENTEGTLGFDNSDYRMERNINVSFAPYCEIDNSKTDSSPSVAAATAYDLCQAERQMFSVSLVDANGNPMDVPSTNVNTVKHLTDKKAAAPKSRSVYFITRKCDDANCSTVSRTGTYLKAVTVSDGDNASKTYTATEVFGRFSSHFMMKVYDRPGRPFTLKAAKLGATQPGTYKIYGFVSKDLAHQDNPSTDWLEKAPVVFTITVPATDSLKTCSTDGTDGYYMSWWNDCLDPDKTQLMTMVTEEDDSFGHIENKSAHGITFKFAPQYSYVPTAVELASVECHFSDLAKGGEHTKGYCNPEEIYVPKYSKVEITGGTFYMHRVPDETIDEYRFTFYRPDTYNMVVMHTDIDVKPCDNVSKIPDTGISLRSPLRAKVKEQTDFVFTGNSLRIPAIGLGMEYPVPIVHVYYENGETNEKGWDLSTLGNYVGELEGGQYLPYAGNSALTGHNWSGGVFKNVGNLNPGDEVIVFANDGMKYTYSVTEKFITEPTDVYSMFQQIGSSSLTLVTCENFNFVTNEYDRRQLVRAVLISSEPYDTP